MTAWEVEMKALFLVVLVSAAAADVIPFEEHVRRRQAILDDGSLLSHERESRLAELYEDTVEITLKVLDIHRKGESVELEVLTEDGRRRVDESGRIDFYRILLSGDVAAEALSWKRWDRLDFQAKPNNRGEIYLNADHFVRHRAHEFSWPEEFPEHKTSRKTWIRRFEQADPEKQQEMLREFKENGSGWLGRGVVTEVDRRDQTLVVSYRGWLREVDEDGIRFREIDPEELEHVAVGDEVRIRARPHLEASGKITYTVCFWSAD